MLKKVALLFVLFAIGFHVYLTLHYYELNYGLAVKESVCNLNSQFNCDTVTASSFSTFLGAPIALWGAATNFILALLLIGWILQWTDNTARLGRYVFALSGITVLASVIMGTISTFWVGSYCLFCIGAYVASFVTFALVYREQEEDKTSVLQHIQQAPKFYYAYLLAIPAITFFMHKSHLFNIGAGKLDTIVQTSVLEWQAGPKFDFSTVAPALSKGPQDAQIVITEFADFRCGHCKQASHGLKAFISSKSDVRLQFYTFPLDPSCNDVIPGGGGDGISCYLAKSVICAEKEGQKGWDMHDFVFSIQENINTRPSLSFAEEQVMGAAAKMQLNSDALKACIAAPETATAIREQARLGERTGVKATPTLYLNNKKLSRGQLVPVIEAVYQSVKKTE